MFSEFSEFKEFKEFRKSLTFLNSLISLKKTPTAQAAHRRQPYSRAVVVRQPRTPSIRAPGAKRLSLPFPKGGLEGMYISCIFLDSAFSGLGCPAGVRLKGVNLKLA